MRCRAQTKAGRRCARQTSPGSARCHAHSDLAVGRPSKLTDEVEKKLCDALRAGNDFAVAAEYAGISRATAHRWRSQAREPGADPRLVAFEEAVRKADADAEVHAVGVLRKGIAGGDWRAAIAYLERRHGERWRPRHHTPATPGATGPQVEDLNPTDPAIRRALNELLRLGQTRR